jgi:hypothetical protein
VWRFLNIREYGNDITPKDGEDQSINGPNFENNINPKKKEDQLALRYDDYFNAKVEAATLNLLPNPFNKGDTWEVRLLAVNFIILTANVRKHWKLAFANVIVERGYCIDVGR